MIEKIKKIWHTISYLGIDESVDIRSDDLKIRIFFNRCIFIGFFALISTFITSYEFIGNYALLNFVNCFAIIIAFVLHIKGYFNSAKRVVVYSLFCAGIVLTALNGGDFLYHTGILTVITFSFVMFSPKKEPIELIIFSLLTVFVFLIGELNLFNAPDFAKHPDTPFTRIFNIIGHTFITVVFISFIRRLNIQYEEELQKNVSEKEGLIEEVLIKTKALEDESTVLEDKISQRTSELREQKEILELKNSEKVVLLQEIHHRVKNNLQIIVSLLNMQSRKFEDPAVLDAISETQNRIISMSLVHQRMYETVDFVAVDFKDYSELLFENIRILHSVKEKGIRHKNEIAPHLNLNIEQAIPLGLVINEMITNSFRHAFNGNSENNEIFINMQENPDETYALKYSDNGSGLPEDHNIDTYDSLGLQLIVALVEQINGDLKFYNEGGAVFEIVFPKKL